MSRHLYTLHDCSNTISARATSAAPTVFKPFHHEPSKQVYIDGGLYHNNPIRIADKEWKLIWRNAICEYPDFVLSLGTAWNIHPRSTPVKKSPPVNLGVFSHGKALMRIAKDHVEDSLDCEKTWRDYSSLLPSSVIGSHIRRFNVALFEDPPALDDVHSLEKLQETVQQSLAQQGDDLRKIAMQLMATSFYFHTSRVQSFQNAGTTITGKADIHCLYYII